jgi:hypothetical protein
MAELNPKGCGGLFPHKKTEEVVHEQNNDYAASRIVAPCLGLNGILSGDKRHPLLS